MKGSLSIFVGAVAVAVTAIASTFAVADLPEDLITATLNQEWPDVDRLAKQWASDGGSVAEAAVLRGYAALAQGNCPQAFLHFQHARDRWAPESGRGISGALANRPFSAVTLLLEADVAARGERVDSAFHALDQALKLEPKFELGLLLRSELSAARGNVAGAAIDLARLASDTPLSCERAVVAATLDLQRGEIELAKNRVDGIIGVEPVHPVAFQVLGLAHASERDWLRASTAFERAALATTVFPEARRSYEVATNQLERGSLITARDHYELGVFATGINAEADLAFAKRHESSLLSGRKSEMLYVGFKGAFPLAGVAKMQREGIQTVVIDPAQPFAGKQAIRKFVTTSLDAGKNPAVLVDVNKVVPTQLGNNKWEADGLAAEVIADANYHFKNETAARGATSFSVGAFHSDGTRPGLRGNDEAMRYKAPFDLVVVESVRSETQLQSSIRNATSTQFVAIQPAFGDYYTQEAQEHVPFVGSKLAYQGSMGRLRGINEPNYRFVQIDDATSPRNLIEQIKRPAHGEAAAIDQTFSVSVYQQGSRISEGRGTLAGFVRPHVEPVRFEQTSPKTFGGVELSGHELSNEGNGRVEIGGMSSSPHHLELVFTLALAWGGVPLDLPMTTSVDSSPQ